MLNGALKGFLIIGLAFSFILLENIGCVAKKRVKPHADTVQNQQIPQADKRGTLDPPFVVKSIPAEKSKQETDDDAHDKDDKRWNDRVTIFIGIATAVILFLQLGVFGWQAHRLKQTIIAMKELGRKQSDDMQGSIAVANKAAEAAKQSADALPTIERAYVFVVPELTSTLEGIGVSYHFINHGKTPAVIDGIAARFESLTAPPEIVSFPFANIPNVNHIILASGKRYPKEKDAIALPEAPETPMVNIDDQFSGDVPDIMWFFGTITYDDIFGKARHTRFRWLYNCVSHDFGPNGGPPYNERT